MQISLLQKKKAQDCISLITVQKSKIVLYANTHIYVFTPTLCTSLEFPGEYPVTVNYLIALLDNNSSFSVAFVL